MRHNCILISPMFPALLQSVGTCQPLRLGLIFVNKTPVNFVSHQPETLRVENVDVRYEAPYTAKPKREARPIETADYRPPDADQLGEDGTV